jgi:putative salt-induced outer membrane protein
LQGKGMQRDGQMSCHACTNFHTSSDILKYPCKWHQKYTDCQVVKGLDAMKFLPSLVPCALLCAAAGSAWAQAQADGQWRGLAGASFSSTSGNSSTNNLLLNIDMARQTERDKISTSAMVNYGSSKIDGVKTTTTDKWGLNGQYDYNLTPKFYVFGKLGLDADKVVNLSLRRTVGTGLGYKVINEANTTFDVFAGVANTHSRYSSTQVIDGVPGTRFSTNSGLLGEESTHKLTDTVFFKQRVELYPRLSGDGGTLAKATANLGVSLSQAISLNVGLTNNYNSAPATGLKKNDTSLFTGLSVKLGG